MAVPAANTAHVSTEHDAPAERLSLVRPASQALDVAAGARNAQALAEQTGLLALNASIEAARAARTSRRFDVRDNRVVELAPVAEPTADVLPLHRAAPASLGGEAVHQDGAGITPLSFKLRRALP